MQALANGQLAMYPEYLDTWDTTVAGIQQTYRSRRDAYLAGQHYALKHGLALLNATPFSNTNAIAVAFDYAVENGVAVDPGPDQGRPPADARRASPVPAEPGRAARAPDHLRRGPVGVQAARARLAVPGARPGDRPGGGRPDDRSAAAQRELPVAARPRGHLRLGQRRAGGVRPRARRRRPGVRGHDQPGQRAAHAAGDARAERGGRARRAGSGDGRDAVPAGPGRAAPALDRDVRATATTTTTGTTGG